MGRPTTAAPLLFMLFTACGGSVAGNPGGGVPPSSAEPKTARPVLTGVLAGSAAGIHFRTQMLEGLTDDAGTFSYYAGETVSFHLGDIVLGSAAAAPKLDLFQIAGAIPPASEAALVAAVLDTDTVTGFDRATNAAMVLLAFDRDDDATNGIELRGIDLPLTGKRLELNREHSIFQADLAAYAQRAAMTWNAVEPADAVAYIYASLDLRIAAHARRVIFRDDHPADAAYDVTTTVTYDEVGRVASSSDVVTDPTLPDTQTVYVRDRHGRETRRETISTVSTSQGQTTTTSVILTNRDGRGHAVLSNETTLEGAALRFSRTDERALDMQGRVTSTETLTDRNGDATADEHQSRTYDYDRATVRYDETFSSDMSAGYLATSLSEFGADGLVAKRRDTTDQDADGVIEFDYEAVYQRDASGALSVATERYRSGVGGQTTGVITTYTRDDEGRNTRTSSTYEGSPQTSVQEVFYDAARRFIGSLATQDHDGNGIADYHSIVEVERDADGNVVSRESRSMSLVDGAMRLSFRSLFTQTFEGGVPVSQFVGEDYNGDGVFETERMSRFEYTLIANGARHIVANARQWME